MAREATSYWAAFDILDDGTEYPTGAHPTEAAAREGLFGDDQEVYEMPFAPAADDARFFTLNSLDAPDIRSSWVDVPAGDADGDFVDETPERLTRAAAFELVAKLNREAHGEYTDSDRGGWWFVVELGRPLSHKLNSTTGLRVGQCGELRTSLFTPIRIVRPTKEECQRYAIDR